MMAKYASTTEVPVERSRAEIEQTLVRYGATEFHSGWKAGAAMIAFRINKGIDLFVRIVLPLPSANEKRFGWTTGRYGNRKERTEQQKSAAFEKEVRQRWRALALVVKAKLEAVECGISTVEQEFLSFVVVGGKDGTKTFGEWVIDQGRLAGLLELKPRYPALPAPPAPAEVIDAKSEEVSR